jgi:transcription elongation factor Elf1
VNTQYNACVTGKYAPQPGHISCSACDVGKSSGAQAIACSNCVAGKYCRALETKRVRLVALLQDLVQSCVRGEGGDITRYHSNRGVSSVSRCAADLEIAERL